MWYAMRGALRAMLNHSPATRKRKLKRMWRMYSGSTWTGIVIMREVVKVIYNSTK